MKKRVLLFFLFITILLNILQSEKIGYVDIDRIFREYSAMNDVSIQLQQLEEKWLKEADEKKRDWLNDKKNLETESVTLSEEEISRRTLIIQQKREDYEKFVQQIWGDNGLYQQKTEELTASPIAQINQMIQEIAELNEYSLVINAMPSLILFAQPGSDLTGDILSRLNADYASIVDTTMIEKTKMVILSIIPITADAKSSGVSQTVNSFVWAIFSNITKLDLIEGSKVSDALTQIGVTSIENINESQLASLATFLEAEYVLTGTISQIQDQYILKLNVFSVSLYGDLITVEQSFSGIDKLEVMVELLVSDIVSSI